VDVVLILLFGFISISTIRETAVELPESTEDRDSRPDVEAVVAVGILSDGTYLVDEEVVRIEGQDALTEYLVSAQRQQPARSLLIRFRASYDSPVGHLMSAAALCDSLGLRHVFQVKLVQSDV